MSYFAGYQVTRAVDNFRTSKLRCGGRMEEKASLPELYWTHSTLRSWPLALTISIVRELTSRLTSRSCSGEISGHWH